MSKGSKRRPDLSNQFKTNYDKIKWGSVKWKPPEKPVPKKVHHIMPDIEPYKPVGGEEAKRGEYITSRSKEREYLKRNNCVQVGTEKDYFFKYNGKSHDNPTREWNK